MLPNGSPYESRAATCKSPEFYSNVVKFPIIVNVFSLRVIPEARGAAFTLRPGSWEHYGSAG